LALNRKVVIPAMATLGLIGSGHIGSTLARLAAGVGLDVVLSNSRGPQTLSDLVGELGPQARAATPAQAAAAGDWVVVTIPVGAIGTVPRTLSPARRSSTPATTSPRVTARSRNSKRGSSPTASCSSGTCPTRTS
jgi:predicted dinucleotide-binding enzyme